MVPSRRCGRISVSTWCSPLATSIWARCRTIVVLPAPPGPSMLTNRPCLRSEERRGVILAPSRRLVTEFLEHPPACQVDEQPGRHGDVVRCAVWPEAWRQVFCQVKGVDQCAELVAGPTRYQPPGELERVEDLGARPVPEL